MTDSTNTRIVPNPDLKAGDKIVTTDGVVTLESDAASSSQSPDMVHADVAAGTLYLAAFQSSRVLADTAEDTEVIDADYLLSKGYSNRDVELFTLAQELGRGRAHGESDEETIRRFCLIDVEDRERLAVHTGSAENELEATAETALAFIESYRD